MTNLLIKKKFRWTFEGRADNGDIAFPETFVRLDDRPAFPLAAIADEHGGHFEAVPGEITISCHFGMMTNEEIETALERLEVGEADVSSGTLRLYDGAGGLIEEWTFSQVEMLMVCRPSELEESAEWLVKYQSAKWHAPLGIAIPSGRKT